MPCYQGTGLGCPVALLAGFPSKVTVLATHSSRIIGTISCSIRARISDIFLMMPFLSGIEAFGFKLCIMDLKAGASTVASGKYCSAT